MNTYRKITHLLMRFTTLRVFTVGNNTAPSNIQLTSRVPQDLGKWLLQLQNITSHLHHYKMFHNSCSLTAVTQICQHRLRNKRSPRLGSFRGILALPPGWQLLWLVVCSTYGSLAWHQHIPTGAGTVLLSGGERREYCHPHSWSLLAPPALRGF